MNSSLPY